MANLRFKYIKIPRLMLSSAMMPEMLVGIPYVQVEDSASVHNTVGALHQGVFQGIYHYLFNPKGKL
jgi:hypothetical protein